MILNKKKNMVVALGALAATGAVGVTVQAEEVEKDVIEGETVNKNDDLTKPNTYWYTEKGEELKVVTYDQTLPDTEGDDIAGYTFVRTHTVTAEDLKTTLTETNFKVGDTINIYKAEKAEEKVDDKLEGKNVDESGKELTSVDGYTLSHTTEDENGKVNHYTKNDTTDRNLDEDGNVVEKTDGYKLIVTKTEPSGQKTNIYHKIMTSYVDESGTVLKDPVAGAMIDEGDGIVEGHGLVKTDIRENGDVINVYKKVVTKWIDEEGKELKPMQDGRHLDKEGDDIQGYYLVKGAVDKDGNVINEYKKSGVSTDTKQDPANPQTEGEKPKDDAKVDETKADDKKVEENKAEDKKTDDKKIDTGEKPKVDLEEQKGPVVKNAASQLLPKTGNSDISYLYGVILAILSAIGIKVKRKSE